MSKITPNLECVSEDSDDYKAHENNCGSSSLGIFEMLEETEIGPKHTIICGQELNTKQLWGFAGLLLLILLSSMGVVLLFATSTFDSYGSSNLTSTNDSLTYQNWKCSCVSILIKVNIFNYTNVDEYEKGNADKLHVEEIGPFVYEELITKVNIKFHANDMVSYQEKRTNKFRADLSKGRKKSDRIIVPNMFLMKTVAWNENSHHFSRSSLSTLLNTTDSEPFLNLPAHQFIWGYDDNLYTLFRDVMPYEKIGLLTSRNGTSEEIVTASTIQSSDGMLFPAYTIRLKSPVDVYFKELCSSFPMVYEKEVKLLNGTVSAYKYVLPENVFSHENHGFCDWQSESCPPQGLFNSTLCPFLFTDFVSFPHFYKANPNIRNAISGVKSAVENHESYFNVHPTSGFVISGKLRLQMNVQVKKLSGISQLDMFEENLILPISWLEVGIEIQNLPDYAKEDIYTKPTVRTVLEVGCILMILITLVAIVIVFVLYRKYRERAQKLSKLN